MVVEWLKVNKPHQKSAVNHTPKVLHRQDLTISRHEGAGMDFRSGDECS